MGLCGTVEKHCCWIKGTVCPYLKEGKDGFFWACALREREGSWDKVYETGEYTSFVRPALSSAGITEDCGDWPSDRVCNSCGEVGKWQP